jgi:hypothetical protein
MHMGLRLPARAGPPRSCPRSQFEPVSEAPLGGVEAVPSFRHTRAPVPTSEGGGSAGRDRGAPDCHARQVAGSSTEERIGRAHWGPARLWTPETATCKVDFEFADGPASLKQKDDRSDWADADLEARRARSVSCHLSFAPSWMALPVSPSRTVLSSFPASGRPDGPSRLRRLAPLTHPDAGSEKRRRPPASESHARFGRQVPPLPKAVGWHSPTRIGLDLHARHAIRRAASSSSGL